MSNSWVYNSWVYRSWIYFSWVYLARSDTTVSGLEKAYCPLHLADLSRWVWYWCIKGNCLIIRFRVQVQQYGKAANIENISPDPSWTIDSGCDLIEGVLLPCTVGTRAILLRWKALTLTMSCSPLSNLQQQRDDKNTWGRKPRTPKTSFLLGIAHIIPPAPCSQFWQFFSVLKKYIFWAGGPPNLGFAQKKGCFLLGFLPLEWHSLKK